MRLFPRPVPGTEETAPQHAAPWDPLWWLHHRDAFMRRFVLAEVLGDPRFKKPRPGRLPHGTER